MTKLPAQFIEDKALRDSARDVFSVDIAHARVNLSAKGVATRIGGHIGEGAKDVIEVARVQADDKRGVLAILIGALVLWLSREPILAILGIGQSGEELDGHAELADSDDEEAGEGTNSSPDVMSGGEDE